MAARVPDPLYQTAGAAPAAAVTAGSRLEPCMIGVQAVGNEFCGSSETAVATLSHEDDQCPVEQIEARILAGDFVNPPGKRVAETEVHQAFERLAEKDRLVKTGQRFELVKP
ncbi:MAG: hypothetical protein B0D91_13355 [Oceanospirillales bacterium LUC14_002_19_P2]|nr:MAG: hypothetical protein B0D91_13355 [Oceanospirillales bacterium LUC14_002_19_P2]